MEKKLARTPSITVQFSAAILLALLAQVARLPLYSPTAIPFITYVPFVLLSAFFGGVGPALLTTFICGLEIQYFAVAPIGTFRVKDVHSWVGMAAFLITGIAAAVLFERLRQTRAAWASAHDAQERLSLELQARQEMLEAIIQYSPAGVALLKGRDFTFEMVNPEYQAFAPGELMVGRSVHEVWPAAAPVILPILNSVRDSQSIFHADCMAIPRQRKPGGEPKERFFDFYYVPLRAALAEDHILMVSQEVTLHKRAQDALNVANDDLRQFAYAVTHDLLEPLRNINTSLTMIDRLQGPNQNPEVRALLAQTMNDCARLRSMLSELYQYTKIAAAPAKTESDGAAVLQQAIANLREAVLESGAEIIYDRLPSAPIPDVHLCQLFQNLIANALKFRDRERKPRIEISGHRDGDSVAFCVSDNGIGFDPRHSMKIFEIFKRLHSADEYSGSGMGLAICARIAASYGGRIWAESTPGNGATFRFALPSHG